jgi:fructokinase
MKYQIISVGEVLWDLLPSGRQLGGAPGNFAYHATVLGAEARPVTRVGNDSLGREILERFRSLGLPTDCITVDDHAPTGTVLVEISPDGQPHFTVHENVAWDHIAVNDIAWATAARADAICFGTLAQRCETSRKAIHSLVNTTPAGALRILDINLRQHFHSAKLIEASLKLANVLKINSEELAVLARLLGLPGGPKEQIARIVDRYELRLAALTRGAGGSLLYGDGHWSDHGGMAATVSDTIGAGDAFTAALAFGILAKLELDEINQRANELATYVCSQKGATPSIPAELSRRILSHGKTGIAVPDGRLAGLNGVAAHREIESGSRRYT